MVCFVSASFVAGWRVSVDNTTFSSIIIQWTNLTSLQNHHVSHYIVLLYRTNGSALMNKVTPGNRLTTEIDGLVHSTNYTVEVFGVDEVGQPYKTPTVNSSTKKSKKLSSWFHFFFVIIIFTI